MSKRKEMQERAMKLFAQCNTALDLFEQTGNRTAIRAWQDQCQAFEREFSDELSVAKTSIVKNMNDTEKSKEILHNLCSKDEGVLDFNTIASTEYDPATTKEELENQILGSCKKQDTIGKAYLTKIKRVRWWQFWRWHLILAHRRECQRLKVEIFRDLNAPTGKPLSRLKDADDFRIMFQNFGIPARITYTTGTSPLGYHHSRMELVLPRYLSEPQRTEIQNIIYAHKVPTLSISIAYTLFWWQKGSKVEAIHTLP